MKKITSIIIALLLTTAFTTQASANFTWTNTWGVQEEFKPVSDALTPYFTNLGPYINGYPDGSFGPDNNVTVGEMAQLIWNMTNRTPNILNGSTRLKVENDGHWAYPALNALVATKAFPMTNFTYDDNNMGYTAAIKYDEEHKLTRKELAWALYCIQGAKNYVRSSSATEGFSDWTSATYGKTYIDIANELYNGNTDKALAHYDRENLYFNACMYFFDAGIIKGYSDGSFKPENPVTRAEAVMMINRAFAGMLTYNTNGVAPADTKGHWAEAEIAKVMVKK